MASHRALVIHALQQPLTLINRPTPEPKLDEILVKVSIVGLNPHDGASKASGVFVKNTLPSPFGLDIIGTVAKVGSGVTKFQLGDEVFAFGNPFSPDSTGTQEYCTVPVYQASLIPSRISPDEAATFPLNAMTMVFALFHKTGLDLDPPFGIEPGLSDYRSESILIIGGGAATGKFGIQFARLANFGSIITVASKSKEDLLKSLGATAVIERNQSEDEIEQEIRALVGDDLVYVIDCVGRTPDGQTLGARALSNTKRGTLAALVHAGGVDESRIGPKRAGYDRKKILCITTKYPDLTRSFWDILPTWIEDGKLLPTTFQVFNGLDVVRINKLLDNYIHGKVNTKPHIHI
ncbi:GroES-like protein [Trichoderma velutinum]